MPDDEERPDREDSGGGAGDGGVDEGRIREIVRDVVGDLLEGRGGAQSPDEEPKPETPAQPRSAAAVEADMEASVRGVIGKLRSEEETQNRLKALEEQTSKPEAPPVKRRLATRIMW